MEKAVYININGRMEVVTTASLPHDNRAFRYGYGLFETILFRDGEIMLKEYHADRLFLGAEQLGISLPVHMNDSWFEEEVKKTVKKNKLERLSRVRLQLYAGTGGLFENTKTGYIIECFPLDEPVTQLNDNGLVLGIAKGLEKSIDSLANLKTSNALIYALAAKQAIINRWNDALVLNTNQNLMESTIANLFVIKDNMVYTPPLSEGCIAGVMRMWVLEQLRDKGFIIIEMPVSREFLAGADEVFLTNAIRRLKWVSAIEGTEYKNHKIKDIYKMLL